MPSATDFRLRYDEQGRPFYDVPGQPGRRSYVSPVALGTGQKPQDTGGIFRGDWQWDARHGRGWVQPADWGNIGNMAALSLLTAGGINAATAGGVGPLGGAAINSQVDKLMAGSGAAAGGRKWFTDALFAGLPKVADLFGAKIASDASEKAAKIQADSYREGLKQLREMYDQDRADFAPYRDAGGRSVTRMSDLLAAQNPTPMPASVQARLSGPGETYTPVPIGPGLDPRTMQPRPAMYGTASSMADLGRPVTPQMRPPVPGQSGPGPVDPNSLENSFTGDTRGTPVSTTMPVDRPGGTVQLLAPTGEVRAVPADQADAWMRLGAKRLR